MAEQDLEFNCVLCKEKYNVGGKCAESYVENYLGGENKRKLLNTLEKFQLLVSSEDGFLGRLVSSKIELVLGGQFHGSCGNCNGTLLEILRLGELIEKSRRRQQELLKEFKIVLSSSELCDDKNGNDGYSSDQAWSPLKVKIEVDHQNEVDIGGPPYDKDEIDLNLALAEQPDIKQKGDEYERNLKTGDSMKLRTRKSIPSLNIKECSVALTRLNPADMLFSKPKIVKKRKYVRRGTAERKVKKIVRKRNKKSVCTMERGPQSQNDLFLLLCDSLFLHNGVLLKFSPDGFTCQEGCGVNVSGLDYNSFKAIRDHVRFAHRKKYDIVGPTSRRECPLCCSSNGDGDTENPLTENHIFSEVSKFREHVVAIHSPPAICTICWRPFSDPEELPSHLLSHKGKMETTKKKPQIVYRQEEGEYLCDMCPKICTSFRNLQSHKKTHTAKDFRPHVQCSECGRQFLHEVSLKDHVKRVHTTEPAQKWTKWRECRICGKKINYKDTTLYKEHIKSHAGKSFFCEICGKGFQRNTTFHYHMKRVHSTERPHQCEFCEMNYKHFHNLKRHRQAVHKDLIPDPIPGNKRSRNLENKEAFIGPKIAYPCEHCEKVFPFKCRLIKHVEASHPSLAYTTPL